MKKLTLSFLHLLGFLMLLSCKPPMDTALGSPKISAGTAKIMGKIIGPKEKLVDSSFVMIFVSHPISGELAKYKVVADQSGRFSIDVDLETDYILIGLYTSLKPYNSLLVKVRSGGTTNIDMTYNQNLEIGDVETNPDMNKYEMMRTIPLINEMLGIYDSKPEPKMSLDDTSPEAFLKHLNNTIAEKLKTINKDSLLSKDWKGFVARDFRLFYYRAGAFDYIKSVKMAYKYGTEDTTVVPNIQKIDKSYFSFFKELDLNNPQNLICSNFMEFQKAVLKNDTLALPRIEEKDVPSWIAEVKTTLSELVGFKEGQYYDILAANAYGLQLNEEKKPLTEGQKKNISDYWKEGEIAKILLRNNQQVADKVAN